MNIRGFSSDVYDMDSDRYNATNVHCVAHENVVITVTIKCNSFSCQTLKYSNKPHTKAVNTKYQCISYCMPLYHSVRMRNKCILH